MDKKQFAFVVGRNRRMQVFPGLVITYREPTSSEVIRYKGQVAYQVKGKEFSTESAAAQIELFDAVALDIEGLGYEDKDGKERELRTSTPVAEIAHCKVEGKAPGAWQDLVPPRVKVKFAETLMAGLEDEAKN
jgi:hypothetical protein